VDHRVADSMPGRDLAREICLYQRHHPDKETTMTAIAAAVLFGIAILMHVSGLAFGQLDSTFFMLAGLLAAALHLAGVGTHYRGRVRR
jgi:hypothetical protein